MAEKYTKEQLEKMQFSILIEAFLTMQENFSAMQESYAVLEQNYTNLNNTMQVMMEQLADHKRHRFGRSTERYEDDSSGQMAFLQTDEGIIYFNEAEAIHDLQENMEQEPEESENTTKRRGKKEKGKRARDLKGLRVVEVPHTLSDEELNKIFADEGYKRLPDEIQQVYHFQPAEIYIEEHHVAVYSGKESETIVKAPHPKKLFRNSLASPSIVAGVATAKYVNAAPLYRQESNLNNDGIAVTRKTLADWMINVSNKYLSQLYAVMLSILIEMHVLQADETPVLVNKGGNPGGDKSYMWLYRTGIHSSGPPIILYEFQKTRKEDHPKEFLKDFSGICVTDGYQVYHGLENKLEGLKIAGCWAHARRKYDEALKALPKDKRNGTLANTALRLIQAIYREEKKLSNLSPEERLEQRKVRIAPLVEAYFSWVRQNHSRAMKGTKTEKGMQYSLNQESYLKVFLTDGEVPIDNNGAERSIRPLCIGKKNWMFCDTASGASASAVIYSIMETAKANNLRPFYYLEYVLTEMAQHKNDEDNSYLQDLVPWSKKLPAKCYKVDKEQSVSAE